jgi:hypothetical protein
MNRKHILLTSLALTGLLSGCGQTPASSAQASSQVSASSSAQVSSQESASSTSTSVDPDAVSTAENPFDIPGNYEAPELTLDGVMDEAEWSDPDWASVDIGLSRHENDSMKARFYRGQKALFVFFTVIDTNILAQGEENGDAVTHSDSVELYIDADNDGINKQGDDYQADLSVNTHTRILTGSDDAWGTYNSLVSFEVKIFGTLNNPDDVDTGFNIEMMFPYSELNITRDSVIGFSLGAPDKWGVGDSVGADFTWFGLTYNSVYIDPQRAENYLVLKKNQIMSRADYKASL